jgi:phenylacetic acid degradation protein PaaD
MDVARAMAGHEGTSAAWKHQIEHVSIKRAVVSMEVLPDMVNGLGVIHGGLAFALADTALAYLACASNELHVTASAAVNFLASARLGERLTATATIAAREGRSTAIDVIVAGAGGRTIATCHGVSRKLGGSVLEALTRSS